MAVEITDANFDELVKNSNKPVMRDVWADWCGPWKMIGPSVEELSSEYEGKALIGKVNVDFNAEVSSRFLIRNIPTILFLKNGEVVDKHVGVAPKNVLAAKLNALL